MNVHVPQGPEQALEMLELSAADRNIISVATSKPGVGAVMDALLGCFRMTLGIQKIRREDFFDIVMTLQQYGDGREDILEKIKHINGVFRKKKKRKLTAFTGKGLFSLLLPNDFNYERRNGADPREPVVKIYQGVLYEGTVDKAIVGTSHNSLIQVLHKEYGRVLVSEFIDGMQFATNAWLALTGFTIGIKDCMVSTAVNEDGIGKEEEIRGVVQKCMIEADGLKETTTHAGIREMRVSAALNKAKDVGLRIAKEALEADNNFLSTVTSGSKGDFFNIAQITGLLGQQNLNGNRVEKVLNNGRRTLYHYPFKCTSSEMEYESRGFITSSLIHGLNPREFFFHACSGRIGISDTATGTATSGYIQRKIVKLMEDMVVQYDGTVRDATGQIFQMAYGSDGLDPSCTVKAGKMQEVCDVTRMVERLNMKHS